MSFTFNGVNCESLGMYVEHYPVRVAAKRKRTFIAIPGRSGDLTETQDAYENVTVSYDVFLKAGASYSETCRLIAEWLLFPRSYAVLQDTYSTGYYREAIFIGPLNIEDELHKYGRAKLTFNCKGQLYKDDYLNGKIVIADTGQDASIYYEYTPDAFKTPGLMFIGSHLSAEITNPLNKPTKPRILITGDVNNPESGTVTIGDTVITCTDIPAIVLIDCENENIIAGTEAGGYVPYNANALFNFSSFPEMPTGTYNVEVSSGLAAIIDPRWWTV